jgi:hypothetical protein
MLDRFMPCLPRFTGAILAGGYWLLRLAGGGAAPGSSTRG